MSLKRIPWTNYFTTDPPLPFDVAFNIFEGGIVTEQILAHRYLLATCSSVFCTEFFGLLAEKRKIIPIKETTGHAFNFLLQYMYGFSLDYDETTVDQLFEILNLAERYDVAALKEHVTEKLAELTVFVEEVVEVAQVALAYNHFETASNSVLLTCSRIVKKNQESRAPLQFPQEDGALVAHLLSIEEPVCCEDELGCAMHDLFEEKCTQRPKVATPPPQNLTSVNWMDLLDPTSRIPADVSFKIIEGSNNNEGEEKVMGEVRAHKYYLAAASDSFKSLFFGQTPDSQSCHTEEVLDYCDNKILNLCEGPAKKLAKQSDEAPVEVKEEIEAEWNAVIKQRICDGGGEGDHMKQKGVEDINVVCSSVGAFQVMIDYLYGKFPTLRGAEEICEIFEIVDLADRFKVVGLEDEYRTAMFLYFRERPRWNSSPE